MKIPFVRPDLPETSGVAAACAEIMESGILTKGPRLAAFEEAVREVMGVRHAIGVSSCTIGLALVMRSLKQVRPGGGSEVILPSFMFLAGPAAIVWAGLTPVFVDVDPATWCVDPRAVAAAVTPRTSGIVAVHLLGHPADMDAIDAVATTHGLWVVEDAAQATFGRYKGRPVGSLGRAATFSFFGNKIITSGEGGAVTFCGRGNNARMRMLRGHGMDPERKYHFPVVGFNYRMSNLTAALACGQMERRDDLLAKRLRDLRAAPAIAKGYRNRAFGRLLSHHMLVELGDDLARGHHRFRPPGSRSPAARWCRCRSRRQCAATRAPPTLRAFRC